MIGSNTRVASATWVVLLVISLHLLLFRLPPINLEWAFADAARYFDSHDRDLLERYFSVQANTLGIPALAYLLHQLIPFIDVGLIPRLIAISGFAVMGMALLRMNNLMGSKVHPGILLASVFFNPLVWIFGGRGTADFFPAALVLFSLAIFWSGKNRLWPLVVAIPAFGLAITLKYHALVLLPLVWLEVLARSNVVFKRALPFLISCTCLILLLPLGYLLTVKNNLGFWLTPPAFQNLHHIEFSPAFFATNFVAYTGYLGLLSLPFSLFMIWRRIGFSRQLVKVFGVAAFLFALGYCFVQPNGEMNFGPLDRYLNARFLGGAFLVFSGAFFATLWSGFAFYRDDEDGLRIALSCAVGIILFLAALSFARPAQRYLLFVLPLFYLFLLPGFAKCYKLIIFTLFISALVNFYILLSQYATGQAAMALAKKIQQRGMLADTNPGAMLGHVGNLFPVNPVENKKYLVVSGPSPKQLFYSESRPLPFVQKIFSVIPVE